MRWIVPRQRACTDALVIVNDTLDELILECKRLVRCSVANEHSVHSVTTAQVDIEDKEWEEEFLNERDPSILHFLVASGDDISSKQLRDDLMTLLIAGHETTAAVLTWTVYCLSQHPDVMARLQAEVCSLHTSTMMSHEYLVSMLCGMHRQSSATSHSTSVAAVSTLALVAG